MARLSGGAFERCLGAAQLLQARAIAAASLAGQGPRQAARVAAMEAADGSGRKRPRSAVSASDDDGAGVSAGEEAPVDAREDAAPKEKRLRTEVRPLAPASLSCHAHAVGLPIRPSSHLLKPTPRFAGQCAPQIACTAAHVAVRRLQRRRQLPLGS